MLYGGGIRTVGRQANILLVTGIYSGGRQQGNQKKKEKIRSLKIREIMNIQQNIMEVIEERRLKWFGHLERMGSNTIPKITLGVECRGQERKIKT